MRNSWVLTRILFFSIFEMSTILSAAMHDLKNGGGLPVQVRYFPTRLELLTGPPLFY